VDPGEVLIRFKPDPAGLKLRWVTARLDLFAAAEEARYNEHADLWSLRIEGESTGNLVAALRADPGVVLAQPNYTYRRASAPNDELYSGRQRPYLAAINMPAAWEIEVGNPSVVVAVVDGGVDINHPEIRSRIWENPGDPHDGVDNDANGCIDDTNGCSFQSVVPDGEIADLDGHGTFVSGIIAAERDNGIGIAGLSNSTILPVRALDAKGIGETEQLVSAINYATESGAEVINLSLALDPGDPACPVDAAVEAALDAAHLAGATMVAATGNFANDCVAFPAASEHVIAVSASGPSERPDIKAFFSNYGPEVDVTAPGMGIVSTCPIPTAVPTNYCPGEAYGMGDGTSFSTPMVSAIAALLLAREPAIAPAEIKQRLEATAQPMPDDQHANWDGAGRLDAAVALGANALYAGLDLGVPQPAELGVSLAVIDGAGVACQVGLWDEQVDAPEVLKDVQHRPSISGNFGVTGCAEQWPPTTSRPWVLAIENHGLKAATLNRWTLTSTGQSCEVEAAPVLIPAQGQTLSEIHCVTHSWNDDIATAQPVDTSHLPLRFEADLRWATSMDDPTPSCLPPAPPNGVSFSRTVWYRLSPSSGGIAADAFGSEMDKEVELQTHKTVLAVYRSTGSGLQEVACNSRHAQEGRIESRVIWRADGNSAYYVMAAAYQSIPMGTLRLNFSPVNIPVNDEPAAALAVSPSAPFATILPAHKATTGVADPVISCAGGYARSLWFAVPSAPGQPLSLSTAGSDFNTVVAVFRADATGNLIEVACNDNVPGSIAAVVNWTGDGGTYLVVAGGFGATTGGVLRLRATSP
jgi:subtilisin family serine protease